MPMYEYRCQQLQNPHVFEEFHPLGDWNSSSWTTCPECRWPALRFLSKPPGVGYMPGPYFDVQLGCVVESRSHMERIAKERGLTIMGVEEHRRSLNNHHETSALDKPDPKLLEVIEKTWHDVHAGNISLETSTPELHTTDIRA